MRLSNALNFLIIVTGVSTTSSVGSVEIQQRQIGSFKDEMVAAHNFFRFQHGAKPLTWNDDLARKAQSWANTCNWFHDSAGENLASGTGFTSWGAYVNIWGSERKWYHWNKVGFSIDTGHFTQVVWKNTKSVGCGWKSCGGGGHGKAKGFYIVCKYDPAGNYVGQFRQNVGKQTKGKSSDTWHK